MNEVKNYFGAKVRLGSGNSPSRKHEDSPLQRKFAGKRSFENCSRVREHKPRQQWIIFGLNARMEPSLLTVPPEVVHTIVSLISDITDFLHLRSSCKYFQNTSEKFWRQIYLTNFYTRRADAFWNKFYPKDYNWKRMTLMRRCFESHLIKQMDEGIRQDATSHSFKQRLWDKGIDTLSVDASDSREVLEELLKSLIVSENRNMPKRMRYFRQLFHLFNSQGDTGTNLHRLIYLDKAEKMLEYAIDDAVGNEKDAIVRNKLLIHSRQLPLLSAEGKKDLFQEIFIKAKSENKEYFNLRTDSECQYLLDKTFLYLKMVHGLFLEQSWNQCEKYVEKSYKEIEKIGVVNTNALDNIQKNHVGFFKYFNLACIHGANYRVSQSLLEFEQETEEKQKLDDDISALFSTQLSLSSVKESTVGLSSRIEKKIKMQTLEAECRHCLETCIGEAKDSIIRSEFLLDVWYLEPFRDSPWFSIIKEHFQGSPFSKSHSVII
jgi:hypothetical protein